MNTCSDSFRQRRHDATAHLLIRAAEAVMGRQSYERVTMRDIAAEAGCVPGTLYLYFKNKQEVVQAIAEKHSSDVLALLNAALAGASDPLARLAAVRESMVHYVCENRSSFRIVRRVLRAVASQLPDELSAEARAKWEQFFAVELALVQDAQKCGQLRRDIPAVDLHRFLLASTSSMLDELSYMDPTPEPAAAARQLSSLLLEGIAKPAPRKPRAAARGLVTLALAVSALMAAGCRAPAVKRQAELARFNSEMQSRTAALNINPAVPLTIDRCVEIALANNLDYRVRRLQESISDDQVRLALAGGLPRVDAAWSATQRSNDALTSMGGGAPIITEDRNSRAASVQAVVPVLDWGTTYYAWRIAKDQKRQTHLMVERARQLLTRDVRTAYVRLAGAQRQERLARVAVLAAKELLRVAQSTEREGLATRAATAEVESGLAWAALSWSNLRRAAEQARLNFAQTMSLPPGQEFTIDDTPPPHRPLPTTADLAALETSALERRPEMRVQDKQRHIAATAVRQQIAAFFPRVDGIGGYNWSSQSMFVNPGYYRFGVQVSDSLLNGGRDFWNLNAARKTVTVEEERTLMLSLGILYEVDFRLVQLFAKYDAQVASEAVVRAQTETLRQVVSRYVQGLETGTETVRSLGSMYVARLELDQAKTDYLATWFELDAATVPPATATAAAPATTTPAAGPAGLPAFAPAAALDNYTKMLDVTPQIDLRQYPELDELLRKADPKQLPR